MRKKLWILWYRAKTKKIYKPNQVDISIIFYANDTTYEKALKKGTESVEYFIKCVLNDLGIEKEELKTRNFRIFQNIRYWDAEKRRNKKEELNKYARNIKNKREIS